MSGPTSNDVVMKSLSERLAETLSETRFDLEYTEVTRDGKRKPVSRSGLDASKLAEVCHAQHHGIVSKSAYVRAPEAMMSELVGELRIVFERFIDPDSDRLGHAFPIDQFGGHKLVRVRPDGLSDFEFESTVEDFANCAIDTEWLSFLLRSVPTLS